VAIPRSGGALPDNGPVNARLVRIAAGVAVALCGAATTGGCGSDEPPSGAPDASQTPVAAAVEPRADLTSRVAAAKDRRFTAAYTWAVAGNQRTVTATVAVDGTWRVDVPGGALGGRATVSLVGRAEGVYQCANGGCVRIARAAATVPSAFDPRVHHPFTDWPDVLTDRGAALSVARAKLTGAAGTCFSVEPATVAIAAPIEAGIFCYDDSGQPTGFKGRFGTLVLAGTPTAAPPSAALPWPVRSGAALGTGPPAPPAPASS
jgi:hypothetical protein